MEKKHISIIVLCIILLILLGINLFYNWKCNKDISDNEKVLYTTMSLKKFLNNLNIFSALIIFIMWVYCLYTYYSYISVKTNTETNTETSVENVQSG